MGGLKVKIALRDKQLAVMSTISVCCVAFVIAGFMPGSARYRTDSNPKPAISALQLPKGCEV